MFVDVEEDGIGEDASTQGQKKQKNGTIVRVDPIPFSTHKMYPNALESGRHRHGLC